MQHVRIEINIQLDTNPSIPSIKLIKFIIPVKEIIKRNEVMNPMKFKKFKSINKFPIKKIKKDVKNWKTYFIFGDNEFRSSSKPIIDKGINKNGMLNSLENPYISM